MFTLEIGSILIERANKTHELPKIKATLRKDSDLEKQLFPEENFFDKPSAARMLFGLIRTINSYTYDNAAAVYISIQSSNLNIIYNCNTTFITKLAPVAKDMLEIGASNAVLNLVLPFQYELDFRTLMYIIFIYGKGGALK